MKTRLICRAFLISIVLVGAGPAAKMAQAASEYVFSAFHKSSQSLFIYTSTDGLNFTLYSSTGYTGPTGVLRDPSIIKHTDGKYYVAYTTLSWQRKTTSFGIASSTDLINWTYHTTVDSGFDDTEKTWAPEWFIDSDGSIGIITSIKRDSTGLFVPYLYTPTDSTLSAWNAPEDIGIGANYIDTFIIKVAGTYHAFVKNESTKYVEYATAAGLTGPWTWQGTGDWAGWGNNVEGPALFRLDTGEWRIFLDYYADSDYKYSTSSNLTIWDAAQELPGLSGIVRHGTVIRVSDDTNAPAAPTGLIAFLGDGTIDLDWDDNTEEDLNSYNVYRSTDEEGPYSQIGTGILDSNYSDSTFVDDVQNYYTVTAVDNNGNESDGSSPAWMLHFSGDLDFDGIVDMFDFGVLGDAWMSGPGDGHWDAGCDISEPNDNVIDGLDLDVFVGNWLEGM
ncbi:MAG: hypothetical protein JSW23_10035 [Planctomycetota bacterium]|nr:MAG: hypothetical protein JSW23_10035 [Planctomycetota bacterium]